MKIHQRSYRDQHDLSAIGALTRQTYTLAPYWNSWSFALYDIWALRKLGDQEVFGITDWQEDICLWEDDTLGLVGAAVFREPHFVKLISSPAARNLVVPMLDWVEYRFQEKDLSGRQLTIEAIACNCYLEDILTARNYVKDAGHYIFRQKELGSTPDEPVALPPGFSLRHIETAEDLQKFHCGTGIVFNFPDNPEVYQILRQAPSFVPELDLILLSPEGKIAAFGSVWFDRSLSLAEFEPVGTLPEFRKMGLGKALIAEACNRLRMLECEKVTVMSWSESVGANRLYESAGLLPKTQKNYWRLASENQKAP
jgi:mycothiol synthase